MFHVYVINTGKKTIHTTQSSILLFFSFTNSCLVELVSKYCHGSYVRS